MHVVHACTSRCQGHCHYLSTTIPICMYLCVPPPHHHSLAVIVGEPLVAGVVLAPGSVVAKVHGPRVVRHPIQLILFVCRQWNIVERGH